MQKYLRMSKKSSNFAPGFATVAQLVEQRIRNAWVGGSSPPSGSKEEGKCLPLFCAAASPTSGERHLYK